ncbi:MAG: hypothetical protein ACI35N_03895 [Marinilabiliaceae bacterium]
MIDTGKYVSAVQAAAQDIKGKVLEAVRATRQLATVTHPAAKADEPKGGFFHNICGYIQKKFGKPSAPAAPDITRQEADARILISEALRAADKRACDDWSDLLNSQRKQLVAEIEAQPGVESIDKVRQSESVMMQSVLSFSLLAEGANLRKADAISTPDGFDRYVDGLAERYAQAVDEALNQQLEIYKRLEK